MKGRDAEEMDKFVRSEALDEARHEISVTLGEYIPDVVRRRPKQPYRAPEGKCFLNGKPRFDYVAELLSPERLRRDGLFNPKAVEKLVGKFSKGDAIGVRDNMALVGVLSAQLTADAFINNFDKRVPAVD